MWENRLWSFGDGASWTIWPSSVCFVLLVHGPSSCSPFQYWIDRPLLLGAIRACVFDRRVDTQILNRANVGWPKFSKSGRSSYYSFQRTANCSLFATCACTWPPSYNCSWAGIAPPQCNKVRSALLTHFEAPNLFTLFFCYMYCICIPKWSSRSLSIGSRAPSNIQSDLSVCIIQSGPQLAGLVFFFFCPSRSWEGGGLQPVAALESKYLITCDMCTVGTRECALNKRVETRKVSSKVFFTAWNLAIISTGGPSLSGITSRQLLRPTSEHWAAAPARPSLIIAHNRPKTRKVKGLKLATSYMYVHIFFFFLFLSWWMPSWPSDSR